MAVGPVGVLLGIVLVFLAPGFFLLQALFPGRRYFGAFHVVALLSLSIAVSVAITIVAGSILGAFGLFEGAKSFDGEGRPILELTLGAIALAGFGVAWWRGAFPLLGREAEYDNIADRGEPEEITLLRDLRLEEERLRKEAARVRKRAAQSKDAGVKLALSEAAADLERDRRDVAKRARDTEAKAGDRRYGDRARRPQ